jgi:hypothetical protein
MWFLKKLLLDKGLFFLLTKKKKIATWRWKKKAFS